MSSRYLGVVSLERLLSVERYCQVHRAGASTQPGGKPEPDGRGERAKAARRQADGTSAEAR